MSVDICTVSRSLCNVSGLGEVGELEVQMFNKPLMLIEVQMYNLALQPPFCQTLVTCSAFYFRKYLINAAVKLVAKIKFIIL